MLYVLVALALPHGYGHRRHREIFRHNEEGVAEQQIDALTLKLEKLEDKVDELMISNAERRNACDGCSGAGNSVAISSDTGCTAELCVQVKCAPPPQHKPAIPHTEGRTSAPTAFADKINVPDPYAKKGGGSRVGGLPGQRQETRYCKVVEYYGIAGVPSTRDATQDVCKGKVSG